MYSSPNFRKDKIPKWIFILSAIVLFILIFQVYAAFLNPVFWFQGLESNTLIQKKVLITLAGRNFVMIVVTIMALKSRNTMFLAYTFMMHFTRELWDMGMVPFLAKLSRCKNRKLIVCGPIHRLS